MEPSGGSPVTAGSSSSTAASRRYGVPFSASNFIQAPLSTLLEYSGILRNPRSSYDEIEPSIAPSAAAVSSPSDGEVAIRIIGAGDHEGPRVLEREGSSGEDLVRESERGVGEGEVSRLNSSSSSNNVTGSGLDGEESAGGGNGRDSSYQRYDIQQVARWIEQILPFSLLLLVVFIRQHLQGIGCC